MNKGVEIAAPWRVSQYESDFGPCYTAIDVDCHYQAIQVVTGMKNGDSSEPYPTGTKRVEQIVRAGLYFAKVVKGLERSQIHLRAALKRLPKTSRKRPLLAQQIKDNERLLGQVHLEP